MTDNTLQLRSVKTRLRNCIAQKNRDEEYTCGTDDQTRVVILVCMQVMSKNPVFVAEIFYFSVHSTVTDRANVTMGISSKVQYEYWEPIVNQKLLISFGNCSSHDNKSNGHRFSIFLKINSSKYFVIIIKYKPA